MIPEQAKGPRPARTIETPAGAWGSPLWTVRMAARATIVS
jgi:hypothetical protein